MIGELKRAIEAIKQAEVYPISTQLDRARDLSLLFLRDHGWALVEALMDAERYRWLRDASDCQIEVYIPTDKNPSGWGAWHGCTDKDAAIDAAMEGYS